jgi:inosose dehydratase
MENEVSRRRLLRRGVGGVLSLALAQRGADAAARSVSSRPAGDPWRGLKVGVASYTLRKLPLVAAIGAIRRAGLSYVSIKDFHLPMESSAEDRRAVATRFREAGITPLSCGVISMQNNEGSVRSAFEYARDAGIPTIVCSPDPASMALLDRMVKEFDLRLAIHNHGPEDRRFPSPYDVWQAVESYDRRIGLCIDVGHTARAGVDPAEAIRKCRGRLFDVHFKDISSTQPNGRTVEAGRGVLDLASVLRALLDVRYSHLVSFEYEKDADDPLPGLAETVGYTKGLLAALRVKR